MSNITPPGSSSNINVNVRALTTEVNVPVHFKTKILHKNIVNGVNTITQEMINSDNTKYIIKYDYVLGGNIVIPNNCILEFDGGSISNASNNNYTITGSSTKVVNLYNYTIFSNVTPTGISTFTGVYQ